MSKIRAVLLLHGFATDTGDFAPLVPSLEGFYDCVDLFTIPGHGANDSFKNFTVDNTFNAIENEFFKLKDKYEIVDVIGFSMGGALALWLACNYKVDNLVLLAPAIRYLNPNMLVNFISYRMKQTFSKMDKHTRKTNIKNFDDNNFICLKVTVSQLIPNYTIKNISTFQKIIGRCNKGISDYDSKTLIIWGRLDQLVPKSGIEEAYAFCTNDERKLVIYDDISHLMLRSVNSNKIIEEIVRFLK